MKIVIVGDGKVGSTLTQYLSKEGHDIVIIDKNTKLVHSVADKYDAIAIEGNGASYDAQMEAGVNKSDLLIAATSSDELNIMCCMLAKKLGAKHTIARVGNPEYAKQLTLMRKDLGLSMSVNPEYETASEIGRILRFPSTVTIDVFAKGRIELAEVKITAESQLDGLRLANMYDKYKIKILVCAVQRGDDLYIPDGNFVLQAGDHIHVTAPHADLAVFLRAVGLLKDKVKNVMILGGGKIAYYVASLLADTGMKFKIIERDEARCVDLSLMLPKAHIICGDGTDRALLDEEGIESMDAFLALTGIDEENIITAMYASKCGVSKTITKVNKVAFDGILADLGLDTIVSPKHIISNRIVTYVRSMQNALENNMLSMHMMLNNRAEALEFNVPSNSSTIGIPLKDLHLKRNLLIAGIMRANKPIIPQGNDTIEEDDRVIVFTVDQSINNLDDILA